MATFIDQSIKVHVIKKVVHFFCIDKIEKYSTSRHFTFKGLVILHYFIYNVQTNYFCKVKIMMFYVSRVRNNNIFSVTRAQNNWTGVLEYTILNLAWLRGRRQFQCNFYLILCIIVVFYLCHCLYSTIICLK